MMPVTASKSIPIESWIAGALGVRPTANAAVGALELAEFQKLAAEKLVDMLDRWGGALLADSVGMGKTRIALAAAALFRRRLPRPRAPIGFIVPARTRSHWQNHIHEAGISSADVVVLSHSAISRGFVIPEVSILIVDEAHRFRNPGANRTQSLADAAVDVPILLVTATPISRGLDDLRNLLSLFLKDDDARQLLGVDLRQAFRASENDNFDLTELLEHVCIRRESADEGVFRKRPTTRLQVVPYPPDVDEAWVWTSLEAELNRLQGELLTRDWPRGLFIEHMLRRWESGAEALAETLTDLVSFHSRWLEADDEGQTLTRAEFKKLFGSSPQQGVLGFMFGDTSDTDAISRDGVLQDLKRLVTIQERVRAVVDAPGGLERAILELLDNGEKLLVFTSYRAAARGIYARLVEALGPNARMGLVTGDEARATGLGKVNAEEILYRFSPDAYGRVLEQHQTLQVLIATDCISEGVSLHDCGRIVLADLPYTPLAIEQRIGRLVRPGSRHEVVDVFLPRPDNWVDSLGMRRRLRTRIGDAQKAGVDFMTLRSTPMTPRVDGVRPFQALATLESLRPTTDTEPIRGTYRAGSGAPARALAVIRLQIGESEHRAMIALHSGAPPSWKINATLELFFELKRHAHLVESTPSAELWDSLQTSLKRRRDRLRAALMAPLFVPAESPQHRAWTLIRDSLQDQEWERCRIQLLRPMTAGRIKRLTALIKAGHISALRDFVKTLPATSPLTNVTLEVLTYVELAE